MSDDYLIDPRSRRLAQMAMDNAAARAEYKANLEQEAAIAKIRLDLVTKFALTLLESGLNDGTHSASRDVRVAVEYADTILSELGITQAQDTGAPK
tara:strand:- start:333 stop:620 length:288 start_codon:yes stop_codon:yes gene_type:complete